MKGHLAVETALTSQALHTKGHFSVERQACRLCTHKGPLGIRQLSGSQALFGDTAGIRHGAVALRNARTIFEPAPPAGAVAYALLSSGYCSQ